MEHNNRGKNAARPGTGQVGWQPVTHDPSDKGLEGLTQDGPELVEFTRTVQVTAHVLGPRGGKGGYHSSEFERTEYVKKYEPEEAPVAVVFDDGREYRSVDGKIFALWTDRDKEPMLADEYQPETIPVHVPHDVPHGTDLSAYVDNRVTEENLIIVGDEMWRRTGEPGYVVRTYGFGSNHGGTGLHIEAIDGGEGNRYRLDEFEQARDYAIEVAADRGDTESVARFEKMKPMAEVKDPSLLTYVPPRRESVAQRDLRFNYERAVEKYIRSVGDTDEDFDEEAAWAELVRLRGDLRAMGGVEKPRG